MAGKKTEKSADATKKSGGGLMPLLAKVFGTLSVLSAVVLFAAIYDVGHLDLRAAVFPFAWAPLALFAIGAIAQIFMSGSKASGAAPDAEALTALVHDIQTKMNHRFSVMQNTLDSVMGKDYETLAAENKELREQLDAIHEAARSKADGELEELRLKNLELEEQIKKWAIEAVGGSVADKGASVPKVA
jgi:hypothetical protein